MRNAGKYAHALSIKGAGVSKRTPLIKPGKSAVLLVTLQLGTATPSGAPSPAMPRRG